MALFLLLMEEGLADDDWEMAKRVLVHDDNVDRFAGIVHAHHVRFCDEYDCTLIHRACAYGRTRCTAWLLQSGADKDAQTSDGWTPLHNAAANGRAGCVAVLLRHGARVNPMGKDGWTPLADAVDQGHQQAARLLLDAGASVELARERIKILPWVDDFLRGRKACEKAVIAFVGSSDRQHRDMARLIGEMVWNTRGAEEWEDASMHAKRVK